MAPEPIAAPVMFSAIIWRIDSAAGPRWSSPSCSVQWLIIDSTSVPGGAGAVVVGPGGGAGAGSGSATAVAALKPLSAIATVAIPTARRMVISILSAVRVSDVLDARDGL